jgi:hypothetical protein
VFGWLSDRIGRLKIIKLNETPIFQKMVEEGKASKAPLTESFEPDVDREHQQDDGDQEWNSPAPLGEVLDGHVAASACFWRSS